MNDTSDSGGHHRYGVIAAVIAATLTLIAAIIGLITVFVQDGRNSESPAPVASAITETHETGGEKAPAGQGKGGASFDPAHDGNSRASAKHLPANLAIFSSIVAGNDEDWYVYQVSKEETATIEVAMVGEERIFSAVLWEGLKEIENNAGASNELPFVVPRVVSAGTRLFVSISDACGDLGCSIGPYKVVVRTSPPG